MSSGQDNRTSDNTIITLGPEEFNDVVRRVHQFLLTRAEKAREKNNSRPTKKSQDNHLEAAKDVFVFVHMVELIEHLSEEISELRETLDVMAADEYGDEERRISVVGPPRKKDYLN